MKKNAKKNRLLARLQKILPVWSKNTALIVAGIIIGTGGVALANPGNIVEKSLSFVGIETESDQIPQSEQDTQSNQDKATASENPSTDTNTEGTYKAEDKKATDSTKKERSTKTGSQTEITPEEIQEQKDSGVPLLIAKKDWNVKVNSRSPSSCGTNSNPCSIGQIAKVNVSAYKTHTNELLPITECNGVVNKPYSFSNATTTTLIDGKHCEIRYTPDQAGMFRLQIELYLSKSVYTDTIYWGGWVWGTDSFNSDGYFVQ
jgi:cytoskeletal protein RodZ